MAFNITPGQPLAESTADEPDKIDDIALDLLHEIWQRYNDLDEFRAFLEGDPLGNEFEPDEEQQFNGMDQLRDMSRNNYAKLIVDATTDRLGIQGFRTTGGQGEFGDEEAMRLFTRDGMDSKAQEAMSLACGYRSAYLTVDPVSKRQQVIPPTNAAVIHDTVGEPVTAITIHRDRALQRQVLRVYSRDVNEMTGQAEGPVTMFVATKEDNRHLYDLTPRGLKLTRYDSEVELNYNMQKNWVWWKKVTKMPSRIPVTVLTNRDGRNEFELHTAVINRLNHMIYQRVIIATMQAFRQRAVKGNFPDTDPRTGKPIDYGDMFEAGPARLWLLPEGSEMWESTPPSFQDVLSSVKDDEKNLGAATYTPMNYFSDSVNASAEGTNMQRENYLSKIEDRKRRFGSGWKRHVSLLFELNDMADRSEEDKIEIIWAPSNVHTLTERVNAFASLTQNGVARKTALREGLGFTPKEIKRAEQESTEQALNNQIADAIKRSTPIERGAVNAVQGNANMQGTNAQTETAAREGGRS